MKQSKYTVLDVNEVKAMRDDLQLLTRLDLKHERIIEVYGGITQAPNYAMVMEHAPYGTVHSLLHSPERSTERSLLRSTIRLQIMHDIASALKHLYDHKIVHGNNTSHKALLFDGHRAKLGCSKYHDLTQSIKKRIGSESQHTAIGMYSTALVITYMCSRVYS
jgi:Protein tyrosine and serine/threonine kinase